MDQVKAGEVVEVTERGKLVALLVSPTPAVAARDRLIGAGRLVPAKSEFQLPVRRQVATGEATATDVLAELRRDHLE